ncbi:hypothetical protein SANTM175S_03652 [Streptomyces antimycoticus]
MPGECAKASAAASVRSAHPGRALAPSLQHKGCYRGGDEQDNEYDL